MNFLMTRTPRERVLIFTMLGIIGALVIWFAVVAPVMSMKADAEQKRQVAQRDFDIVKQGLPQMVSRPAGNRTSIEWSELIAQARAAGLGVSRVQPQDDGSVKIWFTQVTTVQLYTFLQRVNSTYTTDFTRAQINRRDNGVIDAQITISPSA